MTLWLSRLAIARSAPAAALRALIDPEAPGQRMDAHHRLLWSAFSESPDDQRDFLWREEGRGRFLTLSHRPPRQTDLFGPVETQAFAPDLRPGDTLGFALRANATRQRTGVGRVDIVMDALHGLPAQDRADQRMHMAQTVARDWLDRQGQRAGFDLRDMSVADYSTRALPAHRGRRKGQPQFGILEMTGLLSVTDPALLVAAIGQGFGRARAFGCTGEETVAGIIHIATATVSPPFRPRPDLTRVVTWP